MSARVNLFAVAAALVTVSAVAVAEQQRPRAEVEPVVITKTVKRRAELQIALTVRLPKDIHVQAHEPRDPLLIPTVLTVTPPSSVTVKEIVYPPPKELAQKGKSETLAVLGPEFTIDVRVALAADLAAGKLTIPAVLRYQACNESVCFPPARANTQWEVRVP